MGLSGHRQPTGGTTPTGYSAMFAADVNWRLEPDGVLDVLDAGQRVDGLPLPRGPPPEPLVPGADPHLALQHPQGRLGEPLPPEVVEGGPVQRAADPLAPPLRPHIQP